MRIQHNIAAMSSYRNYTNNVSAVNKNLEKLSSGYKINRAGDDAAGLAISEKMRAQISGLEAAQKNAKDGISLVQTAEGALTEVHDMLNRMVTLATQSANGTYDNETDRYQLQKEMDQLKSEIDRIADSSNFNGIKLLDGSMASGTSVINYSSAEIADLVSPDSQVGDGTIVHTTGLPQQATKFNVDLNNAAYQISADGNGTGVSVKIGNTTLSVTEAEIKAEDNSLAAGDIASADTIVKAFVTKYGTGGTGASDVKFNDQLFNLASTPDNHLTFEQAAAPGSKDEVVDGAMSVTITGLTGAGGGSAAGAAQVGATVGTVNLGDANTPATAEVEIKTDPANVTRVTVGNQTFDISPAGNGAAFASTLNFTESSSGSGSWSATRAADTTDADIAAGIAAALNGKTVTIGGSTFNVTASENKLVFTATGNGAVTDTDGTELTEETFKAAIESTVSVTKPTSSDNNDDSSTSSITVTADVGNEAKAAAAAKQTFDFDTLLSSIQDGDDGGITIGDNSYYWGSGSDDINSSSGATQISITPSGSNATAAEVVAALKNQLATDFAPSSGYETGAWGTGDDANKLTFEASSGNTVSDKITLNGLDSTYTAATEAVSAKAGTATATIKPGDFAAGGTLSIGGGTAITFDAEDFTDTDKLLTKINTATAGTGFSYTATKSGDNVTITVTESTAGANDETALKGTINYTAPTPSNDGGSDGSSLTVAAANTGVAPAIGGSDVPKGQDYNASTEVIQQGAAPGNNRLASTYMTIKKVQDGSVLKVGDQTYTFAVGSDSKYANATGTTVVDMTGWTGDEENFVDNALKKLTLAAQADGNTMFSIGYQGNGKVTFTEQVNNTSTAPLDTRDNIAKQFGYALEGQKTGKGLTLQIGDTADSYNQLKVDIKDCHTEAMGIGNISIADQESAADALDAIKSAINYVSDVRGTLGATQNRLDHTINNLSVMTENIQDAESTIRDTDIAEEMMAYTKNNILVQSAQAMLAQANQIPQGVLQLLG